MVEFRLTELPKLIEHRRDEKVIVRRLRSSGSRVIHVLVESQREMNTNVVREGLPYCEHGVVSARHAERSLPSVARDAACGVSQSDARELHGGRPLCVECLFFFQAEDGIRDLTVTGVQTCALPI